jgi:hypothetical protein
LAVGLAAAEAAGLDAGLDAGLTAAEVAVDYNRSHPYEDSFMRATMTAL